MYVGIISGEKECLKGGGPWSTEIANCGSPFLWKMGLFVGRIRCGKEVHASSSVRDVVLLCVQASSQSLAELEDLPYVVRIIVDLGKVLNDLVPGGAAHVLQNDNRGLMFLNPLKHATEGPTRLAIRVNVLLLIVEPRIVDAGRSSDQDLHGQRIPDREYVHRHYPAHPPGSRTLCGPSCDPVL